ncbi:putative reverse transcriptase zinc-binding domain-containing protein [Helianthus anomalus]
MWWWRFKIDPESLWRKVIWSIHHNERTWNLVPRKLSVAGPWKQVAKVSEELERYGINLITCFRAIPGNGRSVVFWKERWLGIEPLQSRFPNLFTLERVKNAKLSDRVTVADGRVVLNFSWIRQPATMEELADLQNMSAVIFNNTGIGEDRWVWELDDSAVFSVKSLKRTLQLNRFANLGNDFVWNNWIPIKVNFLAWRLSLDKVPTLVALTRRNVNMGQIRCSLCGVYDEDADHLFVGYILDWHKYVKGCGKWRKLVYATMQVALWVVWRSRNDVIFNSKEVSIDRILNEI